MNKIITKEEYNNNLDYYLNLMKKEELFMIIDVYSIIYFNHFL